ncbi:MAG TPA: hypothetical protein VGV39_27345 [Mesorhizobium sp.]|jgi:hypothetical protein|uniref:hypothetical protein n=1 Tax=Mesorhizobium sp. TaxID=1871066 RepID=UPI002DDCE0AE|nr:hypothetical protein [Mesorhizobium sp.]HEV2506819.1 hypothetical protein [Mesorhizobium sp.]
MADSDNSTTLPTVTHRRSMAAAARTTRPFDVSTPQSQSSEASHEGLTLHLCEAWQEAHNHTLALCRKHGALEAELVRVIGFPSTRPSLNNGSDRQLHSVDNLPDVGPTEGEAIRDQAIVEPDEHQARWDAMDDQIGYSRMDSLIRQSEATERALLADILLSPASTMDGMLAKLSVLLAEAENRDDPEDFPWPHIRALRNDLTRLNGAAPASIARVGQQLNSESK